MPKVAPASPSKPSDPARREATRVAAPLGTTLGRRSHVLRRAVEFEAVLRSGVRVTSPNFVARALPNSLDAPRLGMIAGKKAAARAVDRNRVKRLIREVFKARYASIGAFDVTIQLRSALRGQNNETVRTELGSLLASLGRRCKARPAQAASPPADGPVPDEATSVAPHRPQ